MLTDGKSPFLEEVISRIQKESRWYRLVVWSGPEDRPPTWAGIQVHPIPRESFDHGSARNLALSLAMGPYLVFLSDDATPVGDEWSDALLAAMTRPRVAVTFGGQRVRDEASLGERLFREHSYPNRAMSGGAAAARDRSFPVSNAHAIYRIAALEEVGGFPAPCSFAEDRIVCGRLTAGGWELAYDPAPSVLHSHNETVVQRGLRGFRAASAGVSWGWPRGTVQKMIGVTLLGHGLGGLASLGLALGPRWLGYRVGQIMRVVRRS